MLLSSQTFWLTTSARACFHQTFCLSTFVHDRQLHNFRQIIVLRPEVLEIPEVYRLYIDLDNDDQKCLQLQTYQLPAKVAENKQYYKEAEARAKAKGEKYEIELGDFIETGCGKRLTADQIESLTNWHNKGIFNHDSFGFNAARKYIMEEKTPSPVWSFMDVLWICS